MKTVGYTITLEVLTPVHVGSGDTVNALDYLQNGDHLHVVDPERWTQWLGEQKQTEQFIRWMESHLQAGKPQRNNAPSLTRFVRERLHITDLSALAKKVSAYSLPMENCAEPDPTRGFKAHIRDAQKRAYLPGSTVKGAIRTALLEDILQEDDNLNRLLVQPLDRMGKGTPDPRQLRREVRRVWQEMEHKALRAGKQQANYDLLRFVLVSDSEPFAPDAVSLRKVRAEGTNRPTDTWVEAVRVGQRTRLTLSFLPEAPLGRLGLDEDLRGYLEPEKLFAVLADRAERRLRRELTYPYYPSAVRQCLQELQQRNSEQAPLLCLGWGQGYLGTTVMGLVLDERQGEYEQAIQKMLSILPRRGQGIVPTRFPKTRRAVRDVQGNAVYPLGWVQLKR
ncbi:MAG: type III-A CRISPR-associated RAMP protein Csm5 [Armatimonadota bacterium]